MEIAWLQILHVLIGLVSGSANVTNLLLHQHKHLFWCTSYILCEYLRARAFD